ncbi:MAG: fibronectin type III domain-containing protein, partial [Methanosarcinaceae archaeon]|nr:fibronectin type III domain-containing protein [Methanosarcinaceae archaeon]
MKIDFDYFIFSKIIKKAVNSLLILMLLNIGFFGLTVEEATAESEVPEKVLQIAEEYKKTAETYYIYYINDKDPFSDGFETNYWYVVVYCKIDPASLNQRKITGSIVIDADNFKLLLFDELPSDNIFYAPALAFNCSFNEDKILQDDFKVYAEMKAEMFLEEHLQHISDNIQVEEAIQNNNLNQAASIICSTISTGLGFFVSGVPFWVGRSLDIIGALGLWNDGNQFDKLMESKVYLEQMSGDFSDLINLCGDLVNIWLTASEGSYQQVRFLIPGSGSYEDVYLQECQYILNGFGKIAEIDNDQETIDEVISSIDILRQQRLDRNIIGSRIFACYNDLVSNYRFVGTTSTGSISTTATTNSISVTATYSGDSDSDGSAKLYYKKSSSSTWIYSGSMSKSSDKYTRSISGLPENTEYDVKVLYLDPDDVNGENPIEKDGIKTSMSAGESPDTPAMDDPGETDFDGTYLLSWTYIPDSTSYQIEEYKNSLSSLVNTYTSTSPSMMITNNGNGNYFYRVRACNDYGCSGWSNVEDVIVNLEAPSDSSYSGIVYWGREISSAGEVKSYQY